MLLKLPSGVFLNGYEFFSSSGIGSPLNILKRPAFVTDFAGVQSAFYYQTYYQGLNIASTVVATKINRYFSLGLGIRLLDVPAIDRRVSDGVGGYITEGNIHAGSTHIPVILGFRLSKYLQLGFSAGHYSEQLDRKTVSTIVYGGELKVSNLFNRLFSLNAGINNLGRGLKYVEDQYLLPVEWHVNLVHVNPIYPFSLMLGIQKVADQKLEYQVGVEYQYFNQFFVNSGYEVKEGLSKGLILGFGIQEKRLRLAYVYQPQNYLGDMHKAELVMLIKKPARRTVKLSKSRSASYQKPDRVRYQLPAPSDLQGDYLAGTLMLGWNFSQSNISESVLFDVYVALHNEGPWYKITGDGISQSRMTFNPKKSATLYFKVRARSGQKLSDYSNIIKVTVKK